MKKLLICIFVLPAILLSLSVQANIISFGSTGDPNFNTSNIFFYNTTKSSNSSGYLLIAAATNNIYTASNSYAAPQATFTWANIGTFDLNGFKIAGAWGSQTLTIDGYNGTNLVQSLDVAVTATTVVDFVANWQNLTSFVINIGNDFIKDVPYLGNGQHWALNNIVINEPFVTVSEPSSLLLMLFALAGLVFYRKKKA